MLYASLNSGNSSHCSDVTVCVPQFSADSCAFTIKANNAIIDKIYFIFLFFVYKSSILNLITKSSLHSLVCIKKRGRPRTTSFSKNYSLLLQDKFVLNRFIFIANS